MGDGIGLLTDAGRLSADLAQIASWRSTSAACQRRTLHSVCVSLRRFTTLDLPSPDGFLVFPAPETLMEKKKTSKLLFLLLDANTYTQGAGA